MDYYRNGIIKMTKKITKLYAAINPDFGPQFAFNAKDDEQATSLIHRYNRYHGYAGYASCRYTFKQIENLQVGTLTLSIQNDWVS